MDHLEQRDLRSPWLLRTKWLISMISLSPPDMELFPFQMAMNMAEINEDDPNYFLNGMILEVLLFPMRGCFPQSSLLFPMVR